MISPTAMFDQSPGQWAGAAVPIAYGVAAALIGTRIRRAATSSDRPARRDIA